MEKQMKAERERREAILRAEGEKKSMILVAEGNKESADFKCRSRKRGSYPSCGGRKGKEDQRSRRTGRSHPCRATGNCRRYPLY